MENKILQFPKQDVQAAEGGLQMSVDYEETVKRWQEVINS